MSKQRFFQTDCVTVGDAFIIPTSVGLLGSNATVVFGCNFGTGSMSVGVTGFDSIGADIGSTTRSMTWSTPWSVTVLLSRAWPVSVPRSALTDVLSSFDGLEPSSLGCCGACSGLGLASASGRETGAGLSGASVDEVGSLTVFFAFRLTV